MKNNTVKKSSWSGVIALLLMSILVGTCISSTSIVSAKEVTPVEKTDVIPELNETFIEMPQNKSMIKGVCVCGNNSSPAPMATGLRTQV